MTAVVASLALFALAPVSHARGGKDDSARQDVRDDRGGYRADEGFDHNVGDDRGAGGADDGINHDANDDRRGRRQHDPANHDLGDDRGAGGADDPWVTTPMTIVAASRIAVARRRVATTDLATVDDARATLRVPVGAG